MIVPIISQVIGVAMQLFAAVSPLVSQVGAALMPAITSIGTALANLANAVLPILASGHADSALRGSDAHTGNPDSAVCSWFNRVRRDNGGKPGDLGRGKRRIRRSLGHWALSCRS